ncbi:hypothetical protein O1M63_28215 [Streptomyces mirabilis]|nr:hypothetical protein [Streptomyces mirabilis]
MNDAASALPNQAPPAFTGRRLLYIGTGALGVMFMPMWLHWLRSSYPDVELRTVITRSATRFVTPTTLSVFGGKQPELDVWSDEPETSAPHVELAHWADTVIVHPATFHFTSRLALGAADTPAMLALQCAQVPVALAPALPPGAITSPAWQQHRGPWPSGRTSRWCGPTRDEHDDGKPGAMTAAPLTEVIRRWRNCAHGWRPRTAPRPRGTRGTPDRPGPRRPRTVPGNGPYRVCGPCGGDQGMTTTPLTAPLVDAFATGFLRTAIHRLPAGGYLWVRRPGADRPHR